MLKIAFIGFRHGHIMGVYNHARNHPEAWKVVGACEEHEPTRRQLMADGKVEITHSDYAEMLGSADCDIVAIGDYYAKRGRLGLTALQHGKHVLSDKPICTDLAELDQITALTASKGLKYGCQLTMRASGIFRCLRQAVHDGMIGEILSISISGQHPLNVQSRPAWYFEPGKHGGTINDIAIHAFDLIPWVTGVKFAELVAARVWPALAPQFPHFQTGAQFMARMTNDAGMLADVSYFKPGGFKGKLAQYWRITLFGSEGVLETDSGATGVTLARNGKSEPELLPAMPADPDINVPDSFAREIQGATSGITMATTQEVLHASRLALLVQRAADNGTTNVALTVK